jgi:hypothetical protein
MYGYGTLRLIMKKSVTVKCYACRQDFEKSKGKYNEAFKLNPNPVFYCGRKCFHSRRREYQPQADKIKVECGYCKTAIFKYASQIRVTDDLHFCNSTCTGLFKKGKLRTERVSLICKKCGLSFLRRISVVNWRKGQSRYTNDYCSRKCSDKKLRVCKPQLKLLYKIANKTFKGNNRSELERFFELQMKLLFPNLKFIANGRYEKFELDFYFPDLLLAIEINGIRHYKPINGQKLLKRVQTRDLLRIELCSSHHVDLRIIPVMGKSSSKQQRINYWKKFQDIILGKLEEKIILNPHRGFDIQKYV